MMVAIRTGLELAAAWSRNLRGWRLVMTRRTNIYDEIDLASVDLSPQDNDRIVRNLARTISPHQERDRLED